MGVFPVRLQLSAIRTMMTTRKQFWNSQRKASRVRA
jgi:hypothetical protein